MTVSVSVSGGDAFRRHLRRSKGRLQEAGETALHNLGVLIVNEALDWVPVDTGALAASWSIGAETGPHGGGSSVEVTFGDPSFGPVEWVSSKTGKTRKRYPAEYAQAQEDLHGFLEKGLDKYESIGQAIMAREIRSEARDLGIDL